MHSSGTRAGLGIRLVLALGVRAQINRALRDSGVEPHYKAGKRVTDAASMQAAAAAAAAVRIEVEARLSRVRGRRWRCRALAACICQRGAMRGTNAEGQGRAAPRGAGMKVRETVGQRERLCARQCRRRSWTKRAGGSWARECQVCTLNPNRTLGARAQGPAVQVVRRHSRSSDAFRYAPAMSTVSGNYVAARRMGVVDGVDFGLTGMARPQRPAARCCMSRHNKLLERRGRARGPLGASLLPQPWQRGDPALF